MRHTQGRLYLEKDEVWTCELCFEKAVGNEGRLAHYKLKHPELNLKRLGNPLKSTVNGNKARQNWAKRNVRMYEGD